MIKDFICNISPQHAEQAALAHVGKFIGQCSKMLANHNLPSSDQGAQNVEV